MPNRLADATSPYLLQHQDNPVDWHEWGEEAFEEAKRRDVPLLLSVGYAACHWCHVMAHESFEDQAIAAEMNRRFVNVKVDREERPDVDSIYMEAVQAMTGHGGWPMTVWLDHEGRPFFAGTYFPKEPRHGMAGFPQVMEAVSTAWQTQREQVADQAERLVAAISREMPPSDLPDTEGLGQAYDRITSTFDPAHGGFGPQPKFPQQPVLEYLLRVHAEPWAPEARLMISRTLEAMAKGGIHDQLGGGFARYSVDAQWLVPHFEKMLYDNAQLARLYLWAGIELDRPDFVEVARSTLGYMERDLRHPEGGFLSSEDADSEGIEGKFYLWALDELEEVLGSSAREIADYYGATEAGNFEGANILSVVGPEPPPGLDEARKQLLAARERRVRPALDDKVVTSWNGLAIRALAEAGAALDDQRLLDLGKGAARFASDHLIEGGRLMRSWRAGRTSVPGFLDDHASLAVGLFSLYAATGEAPWFQLAMDLVEDMERFADDDGRLYSTAEDGEALVKRPTDLVDNPLPSGNALAGEALLIASLYTGDADMADRSARALGSASLLMGRYPTMVAHHLSVLYSSRRSRELAVVGEDWATLSRVYWSRFRPHVALAPSAEPSDAVPLLDGRGAEEETMAYLCQGFVCDLPTADPDRLAAQLG